MPRPPEVALADRVPPETTELYIDDWLYVGLIPLKAGRMAAQHVHDYDHPTVIPYGRVRAWVDDVLLADLTGPTHITIKAGRQHKFLALTDTLILCCHNLRGEGYPGIEPMEA